MKTNIDLDQPPFMNRFFSMRSFLIILVLILAAWVLPMSINAEESPNKVDGIAKPYHFIKLNSQITGKIKTIHHHDGDMVQQDEPLVLLDDALQAAVVRYALLEAESEARVKAAELRYMEMRYAHERLLSAHKKGAAGEWEVKQAELQMLLAEMAIKLEKEEKAKSKAKLLEEKTRLDMHVIKAPVPGIIRRINVEPGQTVSPGDLMIEFTDLSALKAEFFLPIAWFGKMTSKKEYELLAGDPFNTTLTGQLELTDPVFDSASRTFRAVFKIDNPDRSLPAGFPVSFSLKGDAH
jgi:RND family efflux transporter MFP subunit